MMTSYLIGIDIGTLGTKGTLVNQNGAIVHEAFQEHGVNHPRPGWAEQDPERVYWDEPRKIIKALLTRSRINVRKVSGISVSGTTPTLCALDERGIPVRPAILYSDNRMPEDVRHIEKSVGSALTAGRQEITMLPKILWLKKNERDRFSKTSMILNPSNYLVYKLTKKASLDYYLADGYGPIFDRKRFRWREDLCEQIGVSVDILPPLFPATKVIGGVTKGVSKKTGLAQDTPVVVGTDDGVMSLLGAGAIKKRDAVTYYGTAGFLMICNCELPELLSGKSFPDMPILIPSYILSSGNLLRWFRDEFAFPETEVEKKTGSNAYQILDSKAENITPGSDGLIVLPYLSGQRTPIFNPLATGVVFGLIESHTREHLYRSLLESFAYSIAYGLTTVKKSHFPKRVSAIGGGAKSRLWRQIVSDVTNLPQEYRRNASGTLGNAYLAGYGVGIFSEFDTLQTQWLEKAEIVKPRIKINKRYLKLFKIYESLHTALRRQYEYSSKILKTINS
ncbi:FGGY-family carbohydrate kinase [[Eubacterium] cellulosolvens]